MIIIIICYLSFIKYFGCKGQEGKRRGGGGGLKREGVGTNKFLSLKGGVLLEREGLIEY